MSWDADFEDLIMRDVIAERSRQDHKWGPVEGHKIIRDPAAWAAILGEEVGEVHRAILEGEGLEEELVQVAAVAHAWLLAIHKGAPTAISRETFGGTLQDEQKP